MATWKKLVISGSDISQLNNDAGYLTSVTAQHAFTTASFNGTDLLADSSQGTLNFASGSTGLNIVANAGSDTLTFDLVSVPNSSLENSTISGVSLGSDLNDLEDGNGIADFTYNGSGGASITVEADGSTISVGSSGIKVADGQIGTTQIADSLGEIGVNSFTGSFSGSFSGDVDINLADLTAGAGLFGTAYDGNITREFSVDSGSLAGNGIGTSGGAFVVTADSTTGGNTKPVTVGANGVGFDISTIDGNGLTVSSNELAVEADGSTISVGSSGIKVADGQIGTTQIADSLGTLGSNSFTGSFSGSFTGDGSGLTGLATTLTVDGDTGTQDVDLLADDLQIITNATLNSAVTKVGNDVKVTLNIADGGVGTAQIADSLGNINENSFTGSFSGSFVGDGSGLIGTGGSIISGDAADNQVAVFNSSNTIDGYANFTFNDSTNTLTVTGDQSISQDLTVGRNLVVQGTASFQHTTDLQVADRFILMASGSTSTGDGGIVVQQATQNVGELFGFDAGTTRWALDSAFDASLNTFTPDAFMAAVLTGNANSDTAIDALVDARYQAKGNLFIGDDQDIWIYS
eukprot:GHVU01051743.1.p1 GENE.GHVU01051743.1~~GHVU01051743.1.p1  ORF type:complete len:576 (-),score=36.82 GHVU01051743.1:1187-2914(-)